MRMTTYVKNEKGETFYIDTCYTFDKGLETMVFPCDEKGNVTDWGDLDAYWYESEEEAEEGHFEMVEKWGTPIDL